MKRRLTAFKLITGFAFLFGFNNNSASAQLNLEPDISGKWVVSKALQQDKNPFEGTIDICKNGKAVYIVHSNQLTLYLTVKQEKTKDKNLVMLFYMDYADVGRGFSNFDFPEKGTLLMKALWSAEYRMDLQILHPAFVKRLRGVTNANDTSIFPKYLYKNTIVKEPDCN